MMAYALMALLSAAALLLLARPWWSRGGAHVQRRAANVAAYKTRLAELENDVAAGLLDAGAAEQLKTELGARLLSDAAAAGAASAPAGAKADRPYGIALVLLALPVFAGAWYFFAGSWRTQQMVELAQTDPAAAQQLSVDAMVQRLAARLQANPGDAEGWAMLGRSYVVLQRYADAANAYGKANELDGAKNPDWLVGEGEAQAMARDRDLLGRPQQLFDAALKLQPDHVGALWYAGLAAAQARDFRATQAYWTLLSKQADLPGDLREILTARLDELSKLTGEPAAHAAQQAKTAETLVLQVQVSIASELQKQQRPGQTLFVFAKAEQGPPMPLAVQRLTRFKLPLEVRLDDTMGMIPSLKLSQFDRWTVTARLTRGGGVQAQSGDIEGTLSIGRSEAGKPIKLVVNRKIP